MQHYNDELQCLFYSQKGLSLLPLALSIPERCERVGREAEARGPPTAAAPPAPALPVQASASARALQYEVHTISCDPGIN